jgi:hypothetical protein
MSPRHPHAAESGVGKHTARESESAQACAAGKERVANAHTHFLAPEPQGSGAKLFLQVGTLPAGPARGVAGLFRTPDCTRARLKP